jgi:hypothetical protein
MKKMHTNLGGILENSIARTTGLEPVDLKNMSKRKKKHT